MSRIQRLQRRPRRSPAAWLSGYMHEVETSNGLCGDATPPPAVNLICEVPIRRISPVLTLCEPKVSVCWREIRVRNQMTAHRAVQYAQTCTSYSLYLLASPNVTESTETARSCELLGSGLRPISACTMTPFLPAAFADTNIVKAVLYITIYTRGIPVTGEWPKSRFYFSSPYM
jgi:hypothetical protein